MSAARIAEIVHLLAALALLAAFAMLAQRRLISVLRWFAAQGVMLAATAALVGAATGRAELYVSALLTLALKGVLLPWLLWRIIVRLGVHREVEPLVHGAVTMLLALAATLFAFALVRPLAHASPLVSSGTLAIATASVFIGLVMMTTRRKAITQAVGFLAVENALFFAAIGAMGGMPLVVELGIAFDVLMAALIFGLFFFQMRTTFDSLEIHEMESGLGGRQGDEA